VNGGGGYRDNNKRREPISLDEKDPFFEERREIEKIRKQNPEKA
jgi:hypothetical protein